MISLPLAPPLRAALRVLATALAAALILLLCGCGGDSGAGLLEPAPTGGLVDATGCKERALPPGELDEPGALDCVLWEYDGSGRLRLLHRSTAFNCCPEYETGIEVGEGTIHIREREIEGLCACLCLYDLEYEITGLEPGPYEVVVTQEHLGDGDAPLEFRMRLISSPSGEHCEERDHYPWTI